MPNELIKQFQRYVKNGKIEEFREKIIKNNLTHNFINQCFETTFKKGYEPGTKEYTDAIDLSNFVLKLSDETFNQKFGTNLANEFAKHIYKIEQPSVRILNTFLLMQSDVKVKSQIESDEIIKLLNLASNENTIIGTHIIGSELGDKLAKEGISLSGHKFVANDYGNKYGNMKNRLSKNITFFDNSPVDFVTQMFRARGYNNTTSKFNDIMIVSIPKEELIRNEPNLIVKKDLGVGLEDCFNPEYIKGFVRVEVESGNIEGFHLNPLFKDKTYKTQEKIAKETTIEEWENEFQNWYKKSNTTKLEKTRNKVINFLKEISIEKNNKQTDKSRDR